MNGVPEQLGRPRRAAQRNGPKNRSKKNPLKKTAEAWQPAMICESGFRNLGERLGIKASTAD
jgi:hypothetical protein